MGHFTKEGGKNLRVRAAPPRPWCLRAAEAGYKPSECHLGTHLGTQCCCSAKAAGAAEGSKGHGEAQQAGRAIGAEAGPPVHTLCSTHGAGCREVRIAAPCTLRSAQIRESGEEEEPVKRPSSGAGWASNTAVSGERNPSWAMDPLAGAKCVCRGVGRRKPGEVVRGPMWGS